MSDQYGRSRSQKGGDNGSPEHAKPTELRPSPRQQSNNSGKVKRYAVAQTDLTEDDPYSYEVTVVKADDYDRIATEQAQRIEELETDIRNKGEECRFYAERVEELERNLDLCMAARSELQGRLNARDATIEELHAEVSQYEWLKDLAHTRMNNIKWLCKEAATVISKRDDIELDKMQARLRRAAMGMTKSVSANAQPGQVTNRTQVDTSVDEAIKQENGDGTT